MKTRYKFLAAVGVYLLIGYLFITRCFTTQELSHYWSDVPVNRGIIIASIISWPFGILFKVAAYWGDWLNQPADLNDF